MLAKIKRFFKKLLARPYPQPSRSKSNVSLGERVGNAVIATQAQLDKHTDFKVGESYQLGEATVTVHKDKASVLRKIAMIDARRNARLTELTKRGEQIMLMSPEELLQFKLDEWTKERREFEKFAKKLTEGTLEAPPAGSKEERIHKQFLKIMQEVKQKVS